MTARASKLPMPFSPVRTDGHDVPHQARHVADVDTVLISHVLLAATSVGTIHTLAQEHSQCWLTARLAGFTTATRFCSSMEQ